MFCDWEFRFLISRQERAKDELLPTDQSRFVFQASPRIPARDRVSSKATRNVHCYWKRVPRIPYQVQGRCTRWNSNRHVKEPGELLHQPEDAVRFLYIVLAHRS